MKHKIPLLKINIRDQADEKEAVIDIDGEIGGWDWEEWKSINTAKSIKKELKAISKLKVELIIVNINSLGGFLDEAFAIHDILALHEAEIETNVFGLTASAATIIAQAGSEGKRRVSDNSLYLIHRALGLAFGNLNDMEEAVADFKKLDDRLANVYAKRSEKSIKEILVLMQENNGRGKWIDAEEARKFGLADEVFEPMKAAAAVDPGIFNLMGIPTPKGYESNPGTENSRLFNDDLNSNLDEAIIKMDSLNSKKDEFIKGMGGTLDEGVTFAPANKKIKKITSENKKRVIKQLKHLTI